MPPLLECIPNFSEGRRSEVVDSLLAVVRDNADVQLLDYSSDFDHNRTVITYAGEPTAVLDVATVLVGVAAEQIDLDQHQGQHPRLGATDVVPLVPLRDLSMHDCVKLARELGQRIASEHSLPVYMYEEAALRPERRNLATVRHGGYEHLKQTIHLPERAPDYGTARLGKAGAVIVGARPALIAFNVFLDTADVRIAQAIARAIRASSGGLVGVKALGLLVDGRAQVSMNLVDYRRTPLPRVIEMIRSEAHHRGVRMVRSELIGLIPQEALTQAAAWYLQLQDYETHMVLENHFNDPLSV